MPDALSLYPAPPAAQQGNALSDPFRALDALRTVNELSVFPIRQQQMQEQLTGQRISNRRAQIEADTALFDQWSRQNDYAQSSLSGLVGKAQLGKLTPDDVQNWAVGVSRNADPRAIPSSVINSVKDSVLRDPAGVNAGVITMANRVMGPTAGAARVTAPPNPNTGTQQTMPAAAAQYYGTMPTTLPPGATQSAEAMKADEIRMGNFAQELYPWEQAYAKMQELKDKGYTFGPGSQGRQELESFVQTMSPTVARFAGVDPEKVAGYAEVEKYLTQGLLNRSQRMGPHTNEGLATTAAGSPNVHITDLAGIPLVKAQIGMMKLDQTAMKEAREAGPPNYTAKLQELQTKLDPRAFMIDKLSPEEIDRLRKTLKGKEREKFNYSLGLAIKHGVITPPGQ